MTKANDWLVEKFHKLKYRITFATSETQTDEARGDIRWVKNQIEDLEGGIVLKKSDYIKANNLWKKYSDKDLMIDEWEYIDQCLREGKKIAAIKEYRSMKDCGLKDAKNVIEARELKLKGLV
jgi:hypothetical protein